MKKLIISPSNTSWIFSYICNIYWGLSFFLNLDTLSGFREFQIWKIFQFHIKFKNDSFVTPQVVWNYAICNLLLLSGRTLHRETLYINVRDNWYKILAFFYSDLGKHEIQCVRIAIMKFITSIFILNIFED